MNKKERFQAVREKRAPDRMPVWPRVMAQMIYGMGWNMGDVTGKDWYDSDKVTEAVLSNIKNIGYDVAIPAVLDTSFGVPALGGEIAIPEKFGVAVGTTGRQPVMTKEDWPKVQKKLAAFDPWTSDPRMKGALEVIKNVSKAIGNDTPLVTATCVGASAAMGLFRPSAAFLEDVNDDPKWVDEMCSAGTEWTMNWIRAQYEAGLNSVTFYSLCVATNMMSPAMVERFSLPGIHKITEMIRKEFKQGVWIHIHGNMKAPKNFELLKKIVKEAGVEGVHCDELHPPEWVKQQLVDKLGVPACIVVDGGKIASGPIETIRGEVKDSISRIGDGLGMMMGPSCQILPMTKNENFKAWVDATHEYGKFPLQA